MLNKKLKFIIAIIFLIALFPTSKWIWGEAAQAYFDYKCENYAGEFIYRTVENVEGLFQMRPRDPRDYFDRLRYDDIPEDPFGHTNSGAQSPWSMFVRPPKRNFQYLESIMGPFSGEQPTRRYKIFVEKPISTGEKYWVYRKESDSEYGSLYSAKQSSTLESKYGFTWQEVRSRWDRFFGVWGGELIVKELATNEVLGTRRGYFLYPDYSKKAGICPKDKHDSITYYFVSKVLIPPANQNDLDNPGESK